MVSLPPVNPKAPSHVEPEAVDTQKRPGKTPEAVRLMLSCWAVMIAGELLHQILVVVSTALDPAALREAARETAKSRGGEVSDGLVNATVYGSIFVMALLQLAVLVLLAFALRTVKENGSWARNARRLLQIFGGFFGLRMLSLFFMLPSSTTLPVAFYAFDGVIQIILGVAGVMGLIYAMDKDAVAWTDRAQKNAQKNAQKKGK